MNKYLNIIILCFFSVLTVNIERVGYVFFIPIVCFLTFNNQKNMLLIIPTSLLSILWFNRDLLLVTSLVLGVISIFMVIVQKNNYVLNLVFIFLVCFASLCYKGRGFDDIVINMLFALISVVLYGYFCYNLEGVFSLSNKDRNFTYNEIIMATISVIGAASIQEGASSLAIYVAVYFSMYFSKNNYPLHSVFFSLVSMIFLRLAYNIEASLIIPFVAAFYMFPSIYGAVSLICFCLLGMISKVEIFPLLTLEIVIGISILFEFVKFSIISTDDRDSIIKGVYQQAVESINNEVITFASFLDNFSKNFSTPREYSEKLSEGINSLTFNYCDNCYVRRECYVKNKGKLYSYFKELIIYSKRKELNEEDNEIREFHKFCPFIIEIRKSSMLISDKLSLADTSSKSNTLIAELNGISNILRQFSIDKSLKSDLDYEVFNNIHRSLLNYGFGICYFEAKKISQDDFQIEIGIRGEVYNKIKSIIELICDNYITNGSSCLFKTTSRGKCYVVVVPKINFEVEYGYGSLAQEGNNVCGDNYIIKQLTNSKLVAAISDGMGKGYTANQESGKTLKLVDEITSTNVSSETALQILNTFYFIQDYLEKYSTLDYLEIDRNKGELVSYKMGAASSYFFHSDNSFDKITNSSLPFGIEEIVEGKRFKIKDEDLIVMASDGVFENIIDEKDLELFIKGIRHLSPQKITYEILNYVRGHKTKASDDMSVIALKIMGVS